MIGEKGGRGETYFRMVCGVGRMQGLQGYLAHKELRAS